MNIQVTIPDEQAADIIDNICRATGMDTSKADDKAKQAWVTAQVAKNVRNLNTQGAMVKARDNTAKVNETIS